MRTTTTTTQHDTDPAEVITEALGRLLLLILKAAFVTVWWAVLFPMVSVPLALAVAAGHFFGLVAGLVVAGVWIAGMVLWRAKHPETFERFLTQRARTRFLRWWRYRRRWDRLMQACHLAIVESDRVFIPRLVSADIGSALDRLRVKMLPGQCPADWDNRAQHLAHAFGAVECRVLITGPALVELTFRYTDALAEPVALPRTTTRARWNKDAA